MEKSPSLYFIALLPPQAIQDEVTSYKQHFAERYESRHALKSPPHVTLQPPFKWHDDNQAVLEDCVREFAIARTAVPMTLCGFGAFPPRVIYVNVLKTPKLLAIQAELTAHMEFSLGICEPKEKSRPFSPHMTIAFKDLKRSHFKAGWKEFKDRPLYYPFTADRLTLLLHNGQRWNVCQEFPFNSTDAE